MVVLRLYEGVAEEQAAAALGLPVERVRELCTRGMAAVLSRSAKGTDGAKGTGGGDSARAVAVARASRLVTGIRHRASAGGDKEGAV
jgi:hypothetical protein